ncbi:glycosyltransferase family A protein [Demequina sp.]|uniref:glycosyltransferase family A protein n=1 Tax=Demequina sp. TaxID=2050685 RepID=UPI0025C5EDE8|nr:glycosyltransferase family A protein [Demequina sp.]
MSRTTVLIPLHRSLPWVEVVERNARALAPVAHVVVSDAGEADDALAVLRDRLADVDQVSFVGRRAIDPGWVAHCNDLQASVTTEFHMWLAHDDEIGADWVVSAERELDANPAATLACGSITELPATEASSVDHQLRRVECAPELSSTDARVRAAAMLSLLAQDAAPLGLLFRSVQRSAATRPLPHREGDVFSDVVWALDVVAHAPVVVTTAVYRKRWHPDSEHASWPPLGELPGVRAEWSARAVGALNRDDAVAAVAQAWDDELAREAVALRAALAKREDEISQLHAQIEAMAATVSWRTTAPLRSLRAAMGRSHARSDGT